MLGMIALTSLIAFAFCAASILVRVTLKTVFSFGAATSAAGAAAAGPAAAGAEAGMAMSTMFNFDCSPSESGASAPGTLSSLARRSTPSERPNDRNEAHLERVDELSCFEESQGRNLVHDG